jgi:elongation factor G
MDADDGMQIVRAHIPQKELYHYSSRLRSLTGGRGIHTEKLSHYEEMPKELEQKVIGEGKKPVEA